MQLHSHPNILLFRFSSAYAHTEPDNDTLASFQKLCLTFGGLMGWFRVKKFCVLTTRDRVPFYIQFLLRTQWTVKRNELLGDVDT
jgi:hypothetical protein